MLRLDFFFITDDMGCTYLQDFAGFNTNDFVYIKKSIFFVQHTHAAMNFLILALKDLLVGH